MSRVRNHDIADEHRQRRPVGTDVMHDDDENVVATMTWARVADIVEPNEHRWSRGDVELSGHRLAHALGDLFWTYSDRRHIGNCQRSG